MVNDIILSQSIQYNQHDLLATIYHVQAYTKYICIHKLYTVDKDSLELLSSSFCLLRLETRLFI